MAATTGIPPLTSYSTALVLLPPPSIQSRVNPLRSTNDKSFPRWTSHLTLVFPFVEPAHLPRVSSIIRNALSEAKLTPFMFQLDKVSKFKQRDYDTVFLGPSRDNDVRRAWDVVSSAVGYSGRPFVPHLTLGQAHHRDHTSELLKQKGQLLLCTPIEWEVGSVVMLRKSDLEGGLMKIHEEIPLSQSLPPSPSAALASLHPTAYQFMAEGWKPSVPGLPSQALDMLTLATYNILSDEDHPVMPRLPRLISTLLSLQPIPDVVCLQEVTDEFLQHLLADPVVRTQWPWCTHDPTSVLPGKHNIVCLARESLGFTWENVHLSSKHKSAVVLRFPIPSASSSQPNDGYSLIIAGLHLTAGLSSSQQRKKMEELEVLLAYLREHHASSQWILMGDTNIPTSQLIPSSISDSFYDAWLTTHGSEDGGATFNPDINALASATVKADRSPQRYDRIWIRRESEIRVQVAKLFGHGPEEASDHFGLTAALQLSHSANGNIKSVSSAAAVTHAQEELHRVTLGKWTTSVDDDEIQLFVREQGGFPTEAQQDERALVIPVLRGIFSFRATPALRTERETPEDAPAIIQLQSVVRFEFVPVGSVGLGVDTSRSDMDVLVVGNISPKTFWALARAQLRKYTSKLHLRSDGSTAAPRVALKRFVKDASVQMMELWVGNVQVDLQYCSSSKVLEQWNNIQDLPSTDPLFLLPAPSLRTLNAYRDITHILRILSSSLPAFQLAHRALKLFCVSHGIYSSRLGYLGGIHITLLLSRVTLLSPPHASASQLVSTFFATYSKWNWADKAVVLPDGGDEPTYTRAQGREPMVILSVKKPVRNVVQNANKHTTNTIVSVFKDAHQHQSEGVHWSDVCGSGGACGKEFKTGFLKSHGSYVKIEVLFWGSSLVKARAWTRFMESRLPQFLVLLQTSLPEWHFRLWPVRLVDNSASGDLSTGIQSFYLIGLDAPTKPTSVKTIQAPLLAFEEKLRRDERFYDAADMFVSVSQITPAQLPQTITTPPAWSDDGIDPDDDVSDEEDGEPVDEDEDPETAFAPVSSKQIKKNRTEPPRGSNVLHIPAAKLRTSLDVYNRLIWDRDLDTADYLIGYEDRFDGVKEMPLASWKREIEDEAFVPFHRVVHFRRKSDGVLVWDRRKKIDLVFGSGVGSTKPPYNDGPYSSTL